MFDFARDLKLAGAFFNIEIRGLDQTLLRLLALRNLTDSVHHFTFYQLDQLLQADLFTIYLPDDALALQHYLVTVKDRTEKLPIAISYNKRDSRQDRQLYLKALDRLQIQDQTTVARKACGEFYVFTIVQRLQSIGNESDELWQRQFDCCKNPELLYQALVGMNDLLTRKNLLVRFARSVVDQKLAN